MRVENRKVCYCTGVTDGLSSVDRKGLNYQDCEVLFHINRQSPDIAGVVHIGKNDLNDGAGNQGIVFEYAIDETEGRRAPHTPDGNSHVEEIE